MAFGIDFGTTNSVVARLHQGELQVPKIDEPPADWAGLGFERVLPTVVGIDDKNRLLHGWAAKHPSVASLAAVKRLFKEEKYAEIAGKTFEVEEIAAMVFGELRNSVSKLEGLTMNQAVVTIPANSRGLARLRTKVTAGMAGLRVPALINEPTAAAMAYLFNSSREETLLVVDWGGGTLDVTILEHIDGVFIERASKGIQKLGGLDFDTALAETVSAMVDGFDTWTREQRHWFRLDMEKAKILLSSQEETNVLLQGGHSLNITRDMLLDAVRPLVERVREPIQRCLADIGGQPSDIDTVLLVGGTCKMPAVRDFVSDVLERAPAEGIDPMTAIAEGAAVASAILNGELADNDFFVSTEHALGLEVLDRDRAGKISGSKFSELIARNYPLPATETGVYHTIEDYQEQLRLKVLEGDPEQPLNHPDNVTLKEWDLKVNPVPVSESAIELTYNYDRDGILHVSAVDQSNGKEILSDVVDFGGMLDRRGLVEAANRAKAAVESGVVEHSGHAVLNRSPELANLSPELRELVNNARTKVIPFIDDKEAEEMRTQADLVEDGNPWAVDELRTLLDKYPYLI